MTTQPTAHPEATSEQSSTSKRLTRAELEARRLEAAYLLGKTTKTAIARMYEVSRETVYRWGKMMEQGKLKATTATGRPRFLTPEQEQQLKIHCEHGITYDGLREQCQKFGVSFSRDYLGRLALRVGIPIIKMPGGRPRG